MLSEDLKEIVELTGANAWRVLYDIEGLSSPIETVAEALAESASTGRYADGKRRLEFKNPKPSKLTDKLTLQAELSAAVLYVRSGLNRWNSNGGYINIDFQTKTVEDEAAILNERQITVIQAMGYKFTTLEDGQITAKTSLIEK